jgi:hypothetical protein
MHVLVCLLILMQDRCLVCVEWATGLETVLDAPDGTLGDVGYVKSHFGLFADSVSVGAT